MNKLKVLFLCTGNSCRSQMAEGWARALRSDTVEPFSAGVTPHGINPLAVKVMAEAGVDITGQSSKHVDELSHIPLDFVVTVCDHANETCPVFPGKVKRLHVAFDDPPRLAADAKTEEEALPHYRRVRDEIRRFVERLHEVVPLWERELMERKPIVLILCTGNSCRSQMAEGFLEHYAADRYTVQSAGTEPKTEVHPLAVRVMAEIGIDISEQRPKPLIEFLGHIPVRHLLIVCDKAQGSCPRVWPGTLTRTYLPFDDPATFEGTPEDTLTEFRRVRDLIGDAMSTWEPLSSAMRKYAAETLGTFALVFAGTGAIVMDSVSHGGVTHLGVSLTFGLVVMAMIYAVGDVSGAHLNPAVTVGFCLAGKLPGRLLAPYVLSQLAGAFLASLILLFLFGNEAYLGATLPAGPASQSFWLEMILTGLLMFVILCVSTGPKEVGTMAGIAIGGVIAMEAMFAGPICGASMNPARSLAPAVVSGTLRDLWVYLSAPFIGSALAVPLWRLIGGSRTPRLDQSPPTQTYQLREVINVESH